MNPAFQKTVPYIFRLQLSNWDKIFPGTLSVFDSDLCLCVCVSVDRYLLIAAYHSPVFISCLERKQGPWAKAFLKEVCISERRFCNKFRQRVAFVSDLLLLFITFADSIVVIWYVWHVILLNGCSRKIPSKHSCRKKKKTWGSPVYFWSVCTFRQAKRDAQPLP